ncbi:kinase-like protein [Pseudovirgaria hyperparasitica]|uniref:Kinase-like protein n=1 Tax=Pseudovirgaria hyperparasitica TaxID=470096 RepID=A0A6A6WF96_9PEZI|nr:kinase-like protein [Pseudovirgaria hyperparasitica]KAF2761492.1 kinase-like protein [Pseudovirgaria hyperparasitica]
MSSDVQEMNIPSGFSVKNIIAWGTFGLVFLDSASNTVIKVPHSAMDEAAIEIERKIYERFTQQGGHDGLLRYFGQFKDGLRLEFATNQGLLSYLQEHKSTISLEQRLRWCQELSDTLSFVHANGVVHGDLNCNNIFLDDTLRTKVADFGGSSLDDSDLLIMVTASHRSNGNLKSINADIFALGSTFYEILTSKAPYGEAEEDEIMKLSTKSKFPDTRSLGSMGEIIQDCWRGKTKSAQEASMCIEAIRKRHHHSLLPSAYASIATTTVFALSVVTLFTIFWRRSIYR